MLRPDKVPDDLKRGPFTIPQAEAAGISRFQLRGPAWRRVARGAYVWSGLPPDLRYRLLALARHVPAGSAFSGLTAAWIYGLLDRPPDSVAVEATAPRGVVVCDRADLRFLRCELAAGDVTKRCALPVTSPVRTCFDLARRLPLVAGVTAVDAALHRKLLEVEHLRRYVAQRPGWRGVSQARCVIDLSEPATESPMESQLRLLMVRGGLPRPEPQVSIYDRHGVFVARLDLFYRAANLGVEYDGSAHRDSLAADARRLNRLLRAGVSVLRYTAGDVYNRPDEVVEEVRAELAARKHPGFVRP